MPTVEPRATENIPQMIQMIAVLLRRGHAYEAGGEVLFDVTSMPDYGALSHRNLDEQQAGARVAVEPHKRNPGDFVLWKLSSGDEPGWDSPWGRGRPGWHIECSAMSERYLGKIFDIHGGGLDLIFPHHENEIAQSRCAHGTNVMANVWMHNGFLQVEGQKMSKSLGNFVTINELLTSRVFGSNMWHGRVLRLAMLMTHYRQPIDWTVDRLVEARSTLNDWIVAARGFGENNTLPSEFVDALTDDLNVPLALGYMHQLHKEARGRLNKEASQKLSSSLKFLALWDSEKATDIFGYGHPVTDAAKIDDCIAARLKARKVKNWAESDRIRDELAAMGIAIKDNKDGTTTWEVKR
jgi:cysteinyl-tRNA synthetase